jgi:hypothetical protein
MSMTATTIEIVYRVNESDYMAAHELYVANEKWVRRWSRRAMPWEGASFLILGIALLIFTPDRTGPALISLAGIYFLYCGFALRRYFRKRYRTDQRFKHDLTLQISENGLHFVTPSSETQAKWDAVVRYLESKDIFMLFSAPMIFSIIPKRAFSPGEADTFRDLLDKNLRASQPRSAEKGAP